MNSPNVQKNKVSFYQNFFEGDAPYPIVKTNPTSIVAGEHQENNYVKKLCRNIFSNLFIVTGGWFLFVSSSLLFYNFVVQPSPTIAKPWNQLVYFIGGLILLYLKLGKINSKRDLALYGSIPLMGFAFSFLYNFIPIDWRVGDAFANALMLSYILALFIFF